MPIFISNLHKTYERILFRSTSVFFLNVPAFLAHDRLSWAQGQTLSRDLGTLRNEKLNRHDKGQDIGPYRPTGSWKVKLNENRSLKVYSLAKICRIVM